MRLFIARGWAYPKAVSHALPRRPPVSGLRASVSGPGWALVRPVLAASIPASTSRVRLAMSAQGQALPEWGWNRAIGVARWIGLVAADFFESKHA
jgi:hypothetical protein